MTEESADTDLQAMLNDLDELETALTPAEGESMTTAQIQGRLQIASLRATVQGLTRSSTGGHHLWVKYSDVEQSHGMGLDHIYSDDAGNITHMRWPPKVSDMIRNDDGSWEVKPEMNSYQRRRQLHLYLAQWPDKSVEQLQEWLARQGTDVTPQTIRRDLLLIHSVVGPHKAIGGSDA